MYVSFTRILVIKKINRVKSRLQVKVERVVALKNKVLGLYPSCGKIRYVLNMYLLTLRYK